MARTRKSLFLNLPWPAALILAVLALLSVLGSAPGESSPQAQPSSAPVSTPARSPGKLLPPAQPVRAVQVINLHAQTWAEVDELLGKWKKAGVIAVIFRVFKNPKDGFYPFAGKRAAAGVYFNTAHAPVVADALGPFCELARRRGLKVIAWMTTRYANYGREREISLRCLAWDFAKNKPVPSRGYSLLLPEVQDRLAALYRDLAAYPIDGVLLQDDLMLRWNEDFNPRALELFERAAGKKTSPAALYKKVRKLGNGKYAPSEYSSLFHEWRRFQNQALLALAERLRREVQARRPRAPVGLNIFYETITRPEHALDWFAQDMEAALRSDLDFYALMLYHRQMEKELEKSREAVFSLIDESLSRLVQRVDYPQRVWVKVQTVDWDTNARLPAAEVNALLKLAKTRGPVGLVAVPAGEFLDLDALAKVFKKAGDRK